MAVDGLTLALEAYQRAQDELVEARNRLACAIAGAAMSGLPKDEIVAVTGYPADLVLRICRDAGLSEGAPESTPSRSAARLAAGKRWHARTVRPARPPHAGDTTGLHEPVTLVVGVQRRVPTSPELVDDSATSCATSTRGDAASTANGPTNGLPFDRVGTRQGGQRHGRQRGERRA
jgi:hypothetical protein